ncbi:MAG TPA: hypothetical protein VJT73_11810, partial [Polyangiaceae bacterium]|nr:hypothetical protein [Polyangiaceae bacterium]
IGDLLDGLAIPDGPIGDCVHCLVGKCGAAIGACMMNPSCQAGLTCTLVNCLKPTGLDFACVAPCFAGDITSGLTALSGIMCLQTNCAATCGALVEAGTPNDGAARAQGDASATRDVTESGAPFDAASDSAAE